MRYKVHPSRTEYRNEYLKSEEWRTFRNTIISDRPTCEKCKSQKSNDVHHCVYPENGGIPELHEVLAVCRECHILIETAKKFRVIPKAHTQEQAISVTKERISSRFRKTCEFTQGMADRLRRMHINTQRLVCGKLKLPVFPRDWNDVVGMKLTRPKFDAVYFLLKKGHGGRSADIRGRAIFAKPITNHRALAIL